jgi:hypothetical protein
MNWQSQSWTFLECSNALSGRIRDLQAEASGNAFGTLKFPGVLLQKKNDLSLRIRHCPEGNPEGIFASGPLETSKISEDR